MKTSLSVLVPVYNEQHLVDKSLERLKILSTSTHLERIEVIVVDDCSTDDSAKVLERFRQEQTGDSQLNINWIFLRHEKNGGKGQAVKTALQSATCAISVIHDADLEYHPKDLLRIIKVFVEEEADAVYGSRFAGAEVRRVLFFRHELGNKLLTFLSNLVTNLNLSDMETCYKAVRTELLKSIPIESNDFRIEPELTIKLLKDMHGSSKFQSAIPEGALRKGKRSIGGTAFARFTVYLNFPSPTRSTTATSTEVIFSPGCRVPLISIPGWLTQSGGTAAVGYWKSAAV